MANEVSYLLDKLAIAAFKVDLDTDRVTVLSNRLRTFENGLNFKWSNYTLNCLNGLKKYLPRSWCTAAIIRS